MPPLNTLSRSCVSIAISQLFAVPAVAANIEVTNNADTTILTPGNCTLRDAILSANSGTSVGGCVSGTSGLDAITFSDSVLANGTISLTQAITLYIDDDLSITGPATGTIEINGMGNAGVFFIDQADVSLNNLTITGGASNFAGTGISANNGSLHLTASEVSGNSSSYFGAGIFASFADVTITNSKVSGNTSNSFGGGMFFQFSGVNITESEVSGNTSVQAGGGIYVSGRATSKSLTIRNSMVFGNRSTIGNGGGVASANADISLIESTVSGNTADSNSGGGINLGYSSSISLINSSISGNNAGAIGGGINLNRLNHIALNNSTISNNLSEFGGGIGSYTTSFDDTLNSISLTNSTVSGNTASDYGGGLLGFDVSLDITNSTLTGNSALRGGGGIIVGNLPGGNGVTNTTSSLNIINSIIAGNNGGSSYDEIFDITADSTFTLSRNLFGDNSNSIANAFAFSAPIGNNIFATNDGSQPTALSAILAPLANNGGPTQTHALVMGSPAIGVANTAECPNNDQRGQSRDADSLFIPVVAKNGNLAVISLGGDCDIGSFEK